LNQGRFFKGSILRQLIQSQFKLDSYKNHPWASDKALMYRGDTTTDENMIEQAYYQIVLSDRRSLSTWCHKPEIKPDLENLFGTTNCCHFREHA